MQHKKLYQKQIITWWHNLSIAQQDYLLIKYKYMQYGYIFGIRNDEWFESLVSDNQIKIYEENILNNKVNQYSAYK